MPKVEQNCPEAYKGIGPDAWHPHLMLFVPGASPEQLGLRADLRVDVLAVGAPRTKRAEIIIPVPAWADTAGTSP